MDPLFAAMLGAGIGFGVFLTAFGLIIALRRNESGDIPDAGHTEARFGRWLWCSRARRHWKRAVAAAVAGVLVWWLSGWPVAGVAAAMLAWWAREIFGADTAGKVAAAKVEAVAAWVESVRDTVDAGAGLGQSLIAVARVAPPGLEAATDALAGRIRSGDKVDTALRDFARAVDDETCDEAVLALIGAHRRSGDLGALLDRLAVSARENAAMRERIITSRARVRTASRLIAGFGVGMIAIVIAMRPTFLAAYDSMAGQMMLAVILGLFGLSMYWLARMSRWQAPPRLIDLEASSQ